MIVVQPLALGALGLLGREAVGMRRRVVDELGEQDGAGGGERAARPPQVQRRRVAVADRLLARGLSVDRLQRQGHLDQLALRCPHGIVPSDRSSSDSERLPAARPGRVPLAAVAGRVEVAGVEAGERILEVADLVVLGAALGRRARAPAGSAARC